MTTRPLISQACSCALILLLGLSAGAQDLNPHDLTQSSLQRQPTQLRALPLLLQASRLPAEAGAALLRNAGTHVDEQDQVLVEIVGPVDSPRSLDAAIARSGGTATAFFAGRTEALVPRTALEALAAQLPTTHLMQQAGLGLEVAAWEGQGPGIMNSNAYRDDGYDGSGIKICVIDVGYGGLTQSELTSDAPANYASYNYTPRALKSNVDGSHGRFVLETVYDHAPGASYVIMKVDSQTDLGQAVQDAISEGVDIIVMSLGWWPDWEDDGDAAAIAANQAAAAGILFMNSAGNEAKEHYKGQFFDHDADGFHSWDGSTDELLGITLDPGESASFRLTFDRTGGGRDYDLFIFDNIGNLTFASSTLPGDAYESVSITNQQVFTIQVNLAVQRISAPGTTIEIYSSGGTWNEYAKPSSSTTTPSNATHPNVLTVGAVPQNLYGSSKYSNGLIADYSSHGPTNEGTAVPDICAPTGTSTSFAGSFIGTSCACPNAAGVVACLWSVNPAGTAAQVRDLLFEWAARKDWGSPGNDPVYGRGGVHFPAYADCNNDGDPDAFDIASGGSNDNNENWIPDECENPGFGYEWVAPSSPPAGPQKILAAVNPGPGPTPPPPPVSGFTMAFPYDPAVIDVVNVQPAPALIDLLGGVPAVFDVTDSGSSIVIECTFALDPAGGPTDITLTSLTEAADVEYKIVVLGGGGAHTTFPFMDLTTTVPAIVNAMHTSSGSSLPVSLPVPTAIQPVPVIEHLFQVQEVGAVEESEFFVDYDPAMPVTTFEAYWRISESTPDPTPTSAVSLALSHDPSYLAATAVDLFGAYAGFGPEVLLVNLLPDGVVVDIVWAPAAVPNDQLFAGSGAQVAKVTYETQASALLFGNNTGAQTMLTFESPPSLAGAVNHVSGANLSESPQLQHGVVNLIPNTPAVIFRRGDVDANNTGTIGDAVLILSYLFANGAVPSCLDAADANDDGTVTIADPVWVLTYLFQNGTVPPAPGIDSCGADPTPDALDCLSFGC